MADVSVRRLKVIKKVVRLWRIIFGIKISVYIQVMNNSTIQVNRCLVLSVFIFFGNFELEMFFFPI